MRDRVPWTLALAFAAGLLPGVAFGLYVLAVARARWKRGADAPPREIPDPMEAEVERLRGESQQLEQDVARLREENGRLRAVMMRERERINRTVGDLKRIGEAWLEGHRQR